MALFGESELTEGVDGQEQETTGSKKIANAPKRGRPFIVEPRVTPRCRVAIRGTRHLGIRRADRPTDPFYCVTVTVIEFEVTTLLPLT